MRRPGLFPLVAAALLVASEARAQRDVPCKGCVLERPATAAAPVPLLVLLHGDEGNTSVVLPRWSRAARERGYALLALRCPREQGCAAGSWWQWAGAPSWVEGQVEEVGRLLPLDRSRIFLSGWSGGASYMGMMGRQWRLFTGLNLNGGGLPPREGPCPACAPPVYFLAGNRNPLHALAVEARDGFVACGARVEWALLPGKDHGGELEALSPRRAAQILGWLEENAACAPAPPPSPGAQAEKDAGSGEGDVAPVASAVADAPGPAPQSAAAPSPPAPPRRGACGCGQIGGGEGGMSAGLPGFLLFLREALARAAARRGPVKTSRRGARAAQAA